MSARSVDDSPSEMLDPEDIRRLLRDAARLTQAAEATAWLLEPSGEHVRAIRNHGATPSLIEGERIPSHESVVGFVSLTGMSVTIGPGDYQHPRIMERTGTTVSAMAVVPIRRDSEVVGALSVINPISGGRFGASELSELSLVAAQLGERLNPPW